MGDAGHVTHPKPSMAEDNLVEFYLGRTYRGVTIPGNGTPVQKVCLNGYDFEVKFGSKNKLPREVYQLFKDANSRSVLRDYSSAERAPTPMTEFRMGAGEFTTLPDYELELMKEGK